jgi:hypothetical protein
MTQLCKQEEIISFIMSISFILQNIKSLPEVSVVVTNLIKQCPSWETNSRWAS